LKAIEFLENHRFYYHILTYESFGWKVIFHTSFNPALSENVKVWDALQFIALATQFIPRAAALARQARSRPERAFRQKRREPWALIPVS
jgi:hypothetical protein